MKRAGQILLIILGIAVVMIAIPLWIYFPGYNFATVEKGAFYRSRQMDGAALEATIAKYNIRTVVNFRGTNTGKPWYDDEVAVCKKMNVAHVDYAWSRGQLPDPESLLKYAALLETGQKPFLVHCEGGTHRTGVASACYLLLNGADPQTARKQFGPLFKNAPIGQLITLYENSDLPFKRWIQEVYPAQYTTQKAAEKTAP